MNDVENILCKIELEMRKKWMVKVGHPMKLYTKSYKIHLFLGRKKSPVFGTVLHLAMFCPCCMKNLLLCPLHYLFN